MIVLRASWKMRREEISKSLEAHQFQLDGSASVVFIREDFREEVRQSRRRVSLIVRMKHRRLAWERSGVGIPQVGI